MALVSTFFQVFIVLGMYNFFGKREKRGLGGGFGVGPPVYSQNRRLPPSQMGAQMGAYLPPIVPQSPVMPGPRQGRYFKALEGFNLIKSDYSNPNFKFTNYFLESLNFFTILPSGCYLQQKSIFRLIYIKNPLITLFKLFLDQGQHLLLIIIFEFII